MKEYSTDFAARAMALAEGLLNDGTLVLSQAAEEVERGNPDALEDFLTVSKILVIEAKSLDRLYREVGVK